MKNEHHTAGSNTDSAGDFRASDDHGGHHSPAAITQAASCETNQSSTDSDIESKSQASAGDGSSAGSATTPATDQATPPNAIATPLPTAPTLALAAASDSGVQGDNITNVATPTIIGSAEAGSTVILTDGGTQIGSATADPTTGVYSITPVVPLNQGANTLTATSTDAAGASASGSLTVMLASSLPTVTDTIAADGITVTGTGDPNASVTIANATQTVGTVQADASGAWSFDTAALAPGAYSLVASETDAAGNTGAAAPLAVTVPARFDVTDVVTASQTLLLGSDYPGPVDYLQAGYNYTGTDNSVISALVGSVFMHAGTSGENAEVALSGNNVLASGSSSSWLVGATGTGGGNDTFFLSDQGTQQTWDTLVNFHVGDMLTLWDFNPAKGSTTSLGMQGANTAQGDTIAVNFGNGSNSSTLVTFAGLPTTAGFSTTTGSTGGHDFLMMTRTS